MATMNIPANDRRHLPERRQGALHTSHSTHKGAMGFVDYLAMVLLIIGGLNWASVALLNLDLVATFFGVGTPTSKVVYVLVGLAALYGIYLTAKMASRSQH